MTNHSQYATDTFIVGQSAIARELGVCTETIWKWRRFYGFPAFPLPDGRIATTFSLINQWLITRDGARTHRNQSPGRPRAKKQEVTGDSSSEGMTEPQETA